MLRNLLSFDISVDSLCQTCIARQQAESTQMVSDKQDMQQSCGLYCLKSWLLSTCLRASELVQSGCIRRSTFSASHPVTSSRSRAWFTAKYSIEKMELCLKIPRVSRALRSRNTVRLPDIPTAPERSCPKPELDAAPASRRQYQSPALPSVSGRKPPRLRCAPGPADIARTAATARVQGPSHV